MRKFKKSKKILSVNDYSNIGNTPVLKKGIPDNKIVIFGDNPTNSRSYSFSRHYGQGFDPITIALQQTVEIMLSENLLQKSTIVSYCVTGVSCFTSYLTGCYSALGRELNLSDISHEFIQCYIKYLKTNYSNRVTAKGFYATLKSLLIKMQGFGWMNQFDFPRNPFPKSNYKNKAILAFSAAERRRLANSLKVDVNHILQKNETLTGYELTICLLAIALRSGMNATPLLEMTNSSIQEHPLKENRKLLVLHKRRGNATHIQKLRGLKNIKKTQTVLADVSVIVEHVIQCNQSLSAEMNTDLIFCYRSKRGENIQRACNLTLSTISSNIKKWVNKKNLKDDRGVSLKVNVSRLRKTFENRIWELSGGDPFVTAALANHSVQVSQSHYLEAPLEAERRFNYMGKIRTRQLLTDVEVIENNTPISKCSYIPRRIDDQENRIYCTKFLSCVRCRNMVVTREDLFRLYSFYWLIVSERKEIGAKRWSKYFAHIIRIIDQDIAPQFDSKYVQAAKNKGRDNPHKAWKHRHQLEEIV